MDFEFDYKHAYLHEKNHVQDLFAKETHFMPPERYCMKEHASLRRQNVITILAQHARVGDDDVAEHDPIMPYLALSYFDRYVSRYPLSYPTPQYLKLFSICCLVLASKMRYADFRLNEFLEKRNLNYDVEDVMKDELKILTKLQWRMCSITGLSFVDYFISLLKISHKDLEHKFKIMAFRNVGNMYKSDIKFLRFRPSIIAASAVMAAASWSSHVKDAIVSEEHVNRDDLDACSAEIVQQLTNYALEELITTLPASFAHGGASDAADTERVNRVEGSTSSASAQPTQPSSFAQGDASDAADTERVNLLEGSTSSAAAQPTQPSSFAHGDASAAADTEMVNDGKESTRFASEQPTQPPNFAPDDASVAADEEKLNLVERSTSSPSVQPTRPSSFVPDDASVAAGTSSAAAQPTQSPSSAAGDASEAADTGRLNWVEGSTSSGSAQPTQPPSVFPNDDSVAADTERLNQVEASTSIASEQPTQAPSFVPDDASASADTERLNRFEGSTSSASPQPIQPPNAAPGDAADTERPNPVEGCTSSAAAQPTQPPISAPGDVSTTAVTENLDPGERSTSSASEQTTHPPSSSPDDDASASADAERLNLSEGSTSFESVQLFNDDTDDETEEEKKNT